MRRRSAQPGSATRDAVRLGVVRDAVGGRDSWAHRRCRRQTEEVRVATNTVSREFSVATVETTEATNSGALTT